MKIQITALFSGSVLFEHEAENNTVSLTLVAAVKARVNLTDASLDGANLDGANLGGANLARANLAGAYLARANLGGANLDRAYLDGANLGGANLARANLAGANLARANLGGANLARANLGGANLDRAYLDGANLDGASLDGAYLAGANLDGEVLNKAPISLINLQWSILITGQYMRIGCQRHTHEEWRDFTDAKIRNMAIGALAFWRKWKAPLLAICHANHEGPADAPLAEKVVA